MEQLIAPLSPRFGQGERGRVRRVFGELPKMVHRRMEDHTNARQRLADADCETWLPFRVCHV